jgi:hypothetical protein
VFFAGGTHHLELIRPLGLLLHGNGSIAKASSQHCIANANLHDITRAVLLSMAKSNSARSAGGGAS